MPLLLIFSVFLIMINLNSSSSLLYICKKKLLILVLALFFNNCETKNDSIGDFNEIVVATSHIDKDLVYPYISSILLKYINTPLEEEIFKIKWIDAKDFFVKEAYVNNH